jgi:hypothetical protein
MSTRTSPVPSTGSGTVSTTSGVPHALRTAAFIGDLLFELIDEISFDAFLNKTRHDTRITQYYVGESH